MGSDVYNQQILIGASNGHDEYIQWGLLDTSAFLFYRCPNSPYPNPSTALRVCVCVCVPQNGFLRSSFEMKENEENGNGKKMGNKLRHVL